MLHWQRRSRDDKDAAGGFRRVQETNAYAVLPPSHWRGYHEPPPPPLPDPITQAVDELRHRQRRTALGVLGCDPGDELAASLGRLGRTIFGPEA